LDNSKHFYKRVKNNTTRVSNQFLIENAYILNPIVRGIVDNISESVNVLNFTPYWNGKPWKSKHFEINMSDSVRMLILTGSCVFYKYPKIQNETYYELLNTCNLFETKIGNTFFYEYCGLKLNENDLIIISLDDLANINTRLGVSKLQSAIMPIMSLKAMYESDTALIQNQGANYIISNGTSERIIEDDQRTFDDVLNQRIGGAKNKGRIATSTAKIEVHKIGDNPKDLAVWDGYKFKIRDICLALNYPSSLAGDPDSKTYANVLESKKSLYEDCILPLCHKICKALEREFMYDIFIDTSNVDVLQKSQKERFEKNNILTTAVISINQSIQYGTLSKENAIQILKDIWGFDENEAILFLNNKSDGIQ
jgi:Phage portal protein